MFVRLLFADILRARVRVEWFRPRRAFVRRSGGRSSNFSPDGHGFSAYHFGNMFFEELGSSLVIDIGKQLFLAVPRAFRNRRFRKFFGSDAVKGDRIFGVLDPVTHPTPENTNRYVKRFLGIRPDQPLIGPTEALGLCSVRVASYASGLFAGFRPRHEPFPFLIDYNAHGKWDATLFCFGSSDSNLKTLEIEALPEQKFYRMPSVPAGHRVFQVGTQQFGIVAGHDHGILLRMRNPKFPEHALFVCAGLGEWGTSGSAYYLFRNWSSLYQRHRTSDFCKVIRVQLGSDESATEIFSLP